MNEKEIKKGRDNFYSLVKQREHQQAILNQFLALEKDPKVLEYISLLNRCGVKMVGKPRGIDSDETLAVKAFGAFAFLTEDSNKIYVYMGPTLSTENSEVKFHEYKDLETTKTEFVFSNDKEEFEKNHYVIFPECKNKDYFFNKARGVYFNEVVHYVEPEKAIQKVLNLK